MVDLHERLLCNGVPEHVVPTVLGTCGLTIGLSFGVTGLPGIASEFQVVAMVLSNECFNQVLIVPAEAGAAIRVAHAAQVGLLTQMMNPPGERLHHHGEDGHVTFGNGNNAGEDPSFAGSNDAEVLRNPGVTTAVLGPVTASTGVWRQLRLKLPMVEGVQGGGRHVVVSLRGRCKPQNAQIPVGHKHHGGPRFASAELRYGGLDNVLD